MLHDPETYTEPNSFKPERFITEDGQLSNDELVTVAFGFGRRSVVRPSTVQGVLTKILQDLSGNASCTGNVMDNHRLHPDPIHHSARER